VSRRRNSTKLAELFADERCSQAILDFSEWESRGREKHLAALREEEEWFKEEE